MTVAYLRNFRTIKGKGPEALFLEEMRRVSILNKKTLFMLQGNRSLSLEA